jgi:hypothetical protein
MNEQQEIFGRTSLARRQVQQSRECGEKETMRNEAVVEKQQATGDKLARLTRSDEFMDHEIVREFAKRKGLVGKRIDWTNLFLTETQAQLLEHLIEFQAFLANEGLETTAKEIFDAVQRLFERGQTAFSPATLGEVVKEQRQANRTGLTFNV